MKKRKQYNPRKIHAYAAGGAGLIAAVLSQHVADPVEPAEAERRCLSLRLALDQHQPGRWCSFSFRVICHYGRMGEYLGQLLDNHALHRAAVASREALRRIVNANGDDTPHITPRDYQIIRVMVTTFIDLLERQRLSRVDLARAEQASRAVYVNSVTDQFKKTPPAIRQLAVRALRGETLPALAKETGIKKTELSEKIREVVLVVHGLLDSSLIPMPDSMATTRKIAKAVLPRLLQLEEEHGHAQLVA
ncbi:hypothetical protein CEK28_08635 [Xenophilus sp. AP218F]|nr:hypothetical protein CEK28_08635 [Xenophilus sp. AP218F]